MKIYLSEALPSRLFVFLNLYLPGSFPKLYHSEALHF
jgi:hypothetical protein